jgi:hypothetical protein
MSNKIQDKNSIIVDTVNYYTEIIFKYNLSTIPPKKELRNSQNKNGKASKISEAIGMETFYVFSHPNTQV